ncbi:MAG TPA: tetratricopeptide repeat protein [Candidatus Gastranaerophilaceae bacterium]|nr:tetratricopeptide repeat protein [Candidatus Gastranaerophilaceae bacterium]
MISLMLGVTFYLFINNFVFGRIIMGQANNDDLLKKYNSAITLYNVADFYYTLNHFSDENKQIYFQIPYKKAKCYMENKKKKESIQSMLQGVTKIQRQYGIFSRETACFMRKYLIEYYLDNNSYTLANQEFNNLLTIYKNIGYDNNEMADMVRLSGDLSFEAADYESAMEFYQRAYDIISRQPDIDDEVFMKITSRIALYEVQQDKIDLAINIYSNSIETLKNSENPQKSVIADMLIQLGDIYANAGKPKNAIICYEEAVELIKKLPRVNFMRQNLNFYLNSLKDLYDKAGQFHKVREIELEFARQRRFFFML